MEEITNGCLWIWEQVTDYLLCEGDIDTLPTLTKQDDKRYQYNQWAYSWSQVSCTIFAAAGMLSDLKNYEFSEAQLKEMDELSYTRGRVRWQGWYVQSAVKCVADWWNESDLSKTYWKVAYYRIWKYDNEVIQWALDKLYTLDTNYNGNSEYNKDYKADWVLDGTDFWTATYWHSVGVISENWKRSVKDNYKGRKYNIYGLAHPIGEISCYGSFLYIYTNVIDLEEVKRLNEIKTKLLVWIPNNSELWHLTNSKEYQAKLHEMNNTFREWLAYIDSKLKEAE
jgi:hypothetical protein